MSNRPQKPRAALQDRRSSRSSKGIILEMVPRSEPAPPMPKIWGVKWLKSTEALWAEFWRSPISQAVDRQSDAPRLLRWLLLWDEWTRTVRGYRRQRLVLGSRGQAVINPLGRYLLDLERQLERTEERFGLSPLDRMRLGITFGEARRSLQDLNEELEEEGGADIYELPEGFKASSEEG